MLPIHANPWASLRKWSRDMTHFQTNAHFTCTGKVLGLLDHNIMVHPLGFDRDYVFIVVPDSWTFVDRATSKLAFPAPSLSIPQKQLPSSPMAFDDAKAMFASPPRPPVRPPLPVPPSTPTSASLEPSTPPAKRTISDYGQTPTKKRHLSPASSSTIPPSQSHESIRSLAVSASSQDELDVSEADVATAFTSDSPRPHRNRHPPKKYQEVE
ncbi:hypothetical protein FALCPG4_015202 [Fusarium falciforme]